MRVSPVRFNFPGGTSVRLKVTQETIKRFVKQPNCCPSFMLIISPSLHGRRVCLSIRETNPNFIRILDERTGNFLRYYWSGHSLERIAYGFSSPKEFHQFVAALRQHLELLGVQDAEVYIVGSAATGLSYETGQPYDAGRVSDIEIEIRSATLFDVQIEKFRKMAEALETIYCPNYSRAFEEAKLAYKKQPTAENKQKVREANDSLLKVLRSWKKIKKIVASGRLPANFKLPDGFQELQFKILPSFTDRPHMKVGIRISHPKIPESSDVNESSIRII